MAPGYLIYGYTQIRRQLYYGFFLIDTVDDNAPAFCLTGTEYNETEQFYPWLCSTWYVVEDSTTNDKKYDTVNEYIASEDVCDDYNIEDAISTDDTDAYKNHEYICIGNHTLKHWFLEGEYEMLHNTTTSSGRNVWQIMDGQSSWDAYIYYYGDLDDDILWWVIAVDPPSTESPRVYAYCPAMTQHPSDCDACWFFYYAGDWDPDCEVYVCFLWFALV